MGFDGWGKLSQEFGDPHFETAQDNQDVAAEVIIQGFVQRQVELIRLGWKATTAKEKYQLLFLSQFYTVN